MSNVFELERGGMHGRADGTLSPPVFEVHGDEAQRWFDVLSSVKLFYYDFLTSGQVLPETRWRVYDEELTFFGEAVGQPLHTEFIIEERHGKLVYRHEDSWRPYLDVPRQGLEVARQAAREDPRKEFEVPRAERDLEIAEQLQELMPGESLSWDSPFPREALAQFDALLVGGQGYNPDRLMGFLYEAERLADGRLRLTTQSIDGDNEQALQAAREVADNGGDIDARLEAYDQVMAEDGGTYYAGQRIDANGIPENAWSLIQRHSDLFSHYVNKLEDLARDYSPGARLRPWFEKKKKELMYGTLAAFKLRVDGFAVRPAGGYSVAQLEVERERAYRIAVAQAQIFFGCGGVLSMEAAEQAIMGADPEQVRDMIFGTNSESKSKVMHCVNCPQCRTFHDKVRAHGGKFRCKNKRCGYEVKA